jgi:putative hydrolase of the HAD superfamily
MSVTILLHYGPTRTRLSTRSQPVTSDPVQPFPAAKPAVVLLDFYGTLACAVSRGPLAAELFERRGFPFDQPTWDHHRWDALDGLDHQEFSGSREDYEAWEVDRLRRAAQACGVDLDKAEELVAELYAASKDFTVSPYEEVAAVLEELRRRGLGLGVCSNWDWDLDRVLDEAGLTPLVDFAVTSARAGVRKPHPLIFRRALDLAGVTPAEAVFVGDSWEADVGGARSAGIAPVHVWREPSEPPPLVDGVRRIPDLRGLLDLA